MVMKKLGQWELIVILRVVSRLLIDPHNLFAYKL
jgi:hypothetical protein